MGTVPGKKGSGKPDRARAESYGRAQPKLRKI